MPESAKYAVAEVTRVGKKPALAGAGEIEQMSGEA